MVSTKFILSFALLATSIFAAPSEPLVARDKTLTCKNVALNSNENKISEETVKDLIAKAPTDKGKSGYPHVFQNLQKFDFGSACNGKRLLEIPVFKNGQAYNFDSKKPKDNPGPFRGIATQDGKQYCGTISHDGEKGKKGVGKKDKGTPDNPNAGNFHVCT